MPDAIIYTALEAGHAEGLAQLHEERDILDAHTNLILNSRQHWQQYIAQARPGYDLVAIFEGDVIGWARLLTEPHQRRSHCGNVHVAVAAIYRQLGTGTLLLRALLALADDLALQRIEATPTSDNIAARALFAAQGFREEGVLRGARRVGSQWCDEVCLARLSPL